MLLKKNRVIDILNITEDISHIKDIDSLLDRVLLEARRFTNADAGSIYLIRDDQLTFEYVQNETLMRKDRTSNRYLYQKQELPIDTGSIAGYVAYSKQALTVDDVYNLEDGTPYTFNRGFDHAAGYRTQSLLTVPLITSRNKVIGVLQIINAQDHERAIIPFSGEHILTVSHFARQAAVAIEKAIMTREMVLRMIKMAELRDPNETGGHVNRVGAYSIEIYHCWANDRGIGEDEMKRHKDSLRIAAMLHDIGKIGVSDLILKKGDGLSNREFAAMKMHTVFGSRLFRDTTSDWEDLASQVALNHHEKWDGSGYPGHLKDLHHPNPRLGPGKKGEEIPLAARIVTLADVYDALASERSYKKAWREDEIIEFLHRKRGHHFDPALVDTFLSIYDVILAVREKYTL